MRYVLRKLRKTTSTVLAAAQGKPFGKAKVENRQNRWNLKSATFAVLPLNSSIEV